jgi:hypothetical protein
MADKRPSVKNERQYEALKDKGMSKERAAWMANCPGASSRGGTKSGSGGNPKQRGTTAKKTAAGRKGGKASARKEVAEVVGRPRRREGHRASKVMPAERARSVARDMP